MLLTAKHVIENLLPNPIAGGEWIPLRNANNDYSVGRVYDKPLGKLDALVIEPHPAISPTVNQFNPPPIVTVGDAVELELPSQGTLVAASVIEICPLPNVPLSKTPPNLMAVQVFVDQHGVAGDSGSHCR